MEGFIANGCHLVAPEWPFCKKKGATISGNSLFYMEPAGGIEPPTY